MDTAILISFTDQITALFLRNGLRCELQVDACIWTLPATDLAQLIAKIRTDLTIAEVIDTEPFTVSGNAVVLSASQQAERDFDMSLHITLQK